jgi:hypothetical protein
MTQQGYTLGLVLGGARATAVASGGDSDILGDGEDTGGGSDVLGDSGDLGGFDGLTGGSDFGGGADLGASNARGNSRGRGPGVDLAPTAAVATGKPLPRGAIVLGILAALLVSVGMRRLLTAVVEDPNTGIACTLPGQGQ